MDRVETHPELQAQDLNTALNHGQRGFSSSAEDGEFVRLEEKFLLPRIQKSEVEAILKFYLQPCYPDPKTKFTLIESLYFDSADFDLYQNHFGTLERRSKLRTRQYAPDGQWQRNQILLELKAKQNGVCEKVRLRLPEAQYQELLKGNPIKLCKELRAHHAQMKIEKLQRRLDLINGEITKYALKPVCRVTYHRNAYEKNGFRVTIDDQIQYEVLKRPSQKVLDFLFNDPVSSKNSMPAPQVRAFEMLRQYDPSSTVILELKHSGQIPGWMKRLLANRPCDKVSFSKYCYSITKVSLDGAPTGGLRFSISNKSQGHLMKRHPQFRNDERLSRI